VQGAWFLSMTATQLTAVGNIFAGKIPILLGSAAVILLFLYGAVLPWSMFLFNLPNSRVIRGGGELTVDAIGTIVLCTTLLGVVSFVVFNVGSVLKSLESGAGDWRRGAIQRISRNQILFATCSLVYAILYAVLFTLVMLDARIVRQNGNFFLARYVVVNYYPFILGVVMTLPFLTKFSAKGGEATSSTSDSSSLADSLLSDTSASSSSSSSSSTSSSSSVELSEI